MNVFRGPGERRHDTEFDQQPIYDAFSRYENINIEIKLKRIHRKILLPQLNVANSRMPRSELILLETEHSTNRAVKEEIIFEVSAYKWCYIKSSNFL